MYIPSKATLPLHLFKKAWRPTLESDPKSPFEFDEKVALGWVRPLWRHTRCSFSCTSKSDIVSNRRRLRSVSLSYRLFLNIIGMFCKLVVFIRDYKNAFLTVVPKTVELVCKVFSWVIGPVEKRSPLLSQTTLSQLFLQLLPWDWP